MSENIKLEYPVRVTDVRTDDAYHAPRCEVFLDEHQVQWVKFVPRNGYARGNEHMIRTDQVLIAKMGSTKKARMPDSVAP